MTIRRHPTTNHPSILFLAVTVGLAVWSGSSGVALALKPRPTIYNKCVCACYTPATGFGTILDGISNTAGVPCGLYNNRPCTDRDENGATISGTTKYCTGDKTSGTKAMTVAPSVLQNAPVLQSRGIEPRSTPGEGEQATMDIPVLTSKPGDVRMTCGCDGGTGSCSVVSTDGKTSTCQKGAGDTCSGSCKFPIGTISGVSETP
jgi:hypothetical protein